MQYTLVVARDVAILPQDFVNQWNADPACRAIAYASLDDSTKAVYKLGVTYPLPTLEIGAANVDPALFYALIKRILQQQSVCRPTEMIELEKPNGARVLVIKGA